MNQANENATRRGWFAKKQKRQTEKLSAGTTGQITEEQKAKAQRAHKTTDPTDKQSDAFHEEAMLRCRNELLPIEKFNIRK